MKQFISMGFLFLTACCGLQPREVIVLKYNYFEDRWTYEHSDSELKFNYIENRWEWAAQ